MVDLTDREVAALRGELSYEDWQDMGMNLFAKGIVSFDPLAESMLKNPFPLTPFGRELAQTLRK